MCPSRSSCVLLGDAVQGSMIAGDESLQGGLILAATLDDLEEAMRDHGVPAINKVRLAVLEKDGTITVLGMKE